MINDKRRWDDNGELHDKSHLELEVVSEDKRWIRYKTKKGDYISIDKLAIVRVPIEITDHFC